MGQPGGAQHNRPFWTARHPVLTTVITGVLITGTFAAGGALLGADDPQDLGDPGSIGSFTYVLDDVVCDVSAPEEQLCTATLFVRNDGHGGSQPETTLTLRVGSDHYGPASVAGLDEPFFPSQRRECVATFTIPIGAYPTQLRIVPGEGTESLFDVFIPGYNEWVVYSIDP